MFIALIVTEVGKTFVDSIISWKVLVNVSVKTG